MNRNQRIIELRNKGLSYQSIGKIFDISYQRAQQIAVGINSRNVRVWNKIRDDIKKRDDYTCQICGFKKKKLVVHHIDEVPTNNKYNNLVCLCDSCHIHLHSQSGSVDKSKYPRIYCV
ncbi:MAG: HNH endonuclease [Bacteroidia bacterium]|nr:HNH endonuclease [Bacteroidia bacterium]